MKLLPRLLLCLFSLHAGGQQARACIWYDGTTLEGNFARTEPPPQLPTGTLLKEEPAYFAQARNSYRFNAEQLRKASEFSPEWILERNTHPDKLPPGWPEGMDDAVRLIFAGKAGEAVTRLTELDRQTPDNYWISANLAAASELSGDLPAAQRWVEKALTINPGAHEGTEWMHAAVIRARIALESDPAWLKTHTVSGIPLEGDLRAGFTLTDGTQTRNLEDIHRALLAHTFARLIFVKPKDPVAAALLTELARVEARQESVESGLAMLTLAEEYGADIADLKAHWQSLQPGPLRLWLKRNSDYVPVAVTALGGILLSVGYYFFRRWQTAKKLRTPVSSTAVG
jgi:hypothetical protein